MNILPRTQFGDPILRKKAKKISFSLFRTRKGKELIRRMLYTMFRTKGVGLAAPQVGKSIALAVMRMIPFSRHPDLERIGPIVIVNPKITNYSRKKLYDWEGCLSCSGMRGLVPRSKEITVEYYNLHGEKVVERAKGYWARIFQHEVDHLNGNLYIDRMDDIKTLMTLKELKKKLKKKLK
ncbi:MAG: peptide deformylase [Patescibacteria group bacterium]